MMLKTTLCLILFFTSSEYVFAMEIPSAPDVQLNLNFVWILIAAFLVFFMQAGFTMVEVGFTRAKNASNVIMKNLMDFCIGSLAFWAIGFGLMFGTTNTGWFGTDGFFLSDFIKDNDPWIYAFWIFQVVFAATAATIISGAMAERTRFIGYLIYSAVISAFIYPVFGSWAWGGLHHGGGWLENMGFIDFAGSTVVHSVGGWAALAGTIVVGPRIGKFSKDGRIKPITGHNLPLAALGVMILWFGWYGFNAGSTMSGNADIALIAVNTTLAAAAGALFAMVTAWVKYGIPDVGISLSGALAGLVGITAGCANLTPAFAIITGAVAGIIVVFALSSIENFKVDDPVGAISIHGVCGVWGTLAAGVFNSAGMFSAKIIGVQVLGIAACFLWVFPSMYLVFKGIDRLVGLRVSETDEYNGLDFSEHGATSYPDFPVTATH
ncbi:MAG: ammonium transporter [bacterium]|nr:MAG: ammonium transporter [bacterium]